MAPSDSFTELLQRAQAGDRRAMDLLLEEFQAIIEKAARPYTDPDQAAESASDLVQESKLRAWQRVGQFRGAGDEVQVRAMFGAWLGQIARTVGLNAREARNARKRRAPNAAYVRIGGGGGSTTHAGFDPASSDPSPSAEAGKDERASLIQAALERLPSAESREVVRLCFFDGLTLRQVAERLALTYSQVRERYHAAMRVLERDLKDIL
jgi:RNA polymerase sigma factor (sigma-70 family)